MSFKPGDLVLAKVPSYAKWPAVIVPFELVPKAVMKQRNKKDYCVFFFGNDPSYFWGDDKSITPLKVSDCESLAKKGKGLVKKLYMHALEYRDDFLGVLSPTEEPRTNIEADDDEEDEDQEYREDEEEEEEEDEDEDDDEDVIKVKRRNQRRPTSKKATARNAPSKQVTPRSKIVPSRTQSPSYLTWTDEEKHKNFWYIRTKLQKGLISRKDPPTVQELQLCSNILAKLEALNEENIVDLNVLKNAKLHKVLKLILKIEKLERPDDMKFHQRCAILLKKWTPMILIIKNEKLSSPTVLSGSENTLTDIKKESNGGRNGLSVIQSIDKKIMS